MSKSAITTELKNCGLPPSRPISPGEVLRNEFLPHLGITQTKLAEALGMPLQRLNLILNGKRGVSPDTAIRFSKVLGPSPKFWLGLQQNVDLHDAIVAFHKTSKKTLKRLEVPASAPSTEAIQEPSPRPHTHQPTMERPGSSASSGA